MINIIKSGQGIPQNQLIPFGTRLNSRSVFKYTIACLAFPALMFCSGTVHAALTVKVDEPKQVGKKVVIKLTMKNAFTENVESARAQVFLLDDKGKITGQAVRWVIGGTKDRPTLAPNAETTFNFVVTANKSFVTNKVTFTRIILEGGKLADVTKEVTITPAAK